jgi:hypothetical protein
MIPKHELDNLDMAAEEAQDLAETGETTEGLDILEGGLYRAEQLREAGEEWGAELVQRWQAVLQSYREEYGAEP